MYNCSLVARCFLWGRGGNVWSLSHTFVIYWNAIILHYINLLSFMRTIWRAFCLLVLRYDQRQQVNTASLRPVYEELLKLCHENRVVSEVFTQLGTFLCRPCNRKVEAVMHLQKELMEKKGTLEN